MGKIKKWMTALFKKGYHPKKVKSSEEVELLKTEFKARYHSFKLLLNANNKALEIMTEIEEALRGSQPFGMSFVKSRITALSTSVFKVIKHLDELAPHKYELLFDRFFEIRKKIDPYLKQKSWPKEGPLVVGLEEININMADLVGPKAAYLAEISKIEGIGIPEGFVVTAAGYRKFLEHNELHLEIERRIQAAGAETMEQLFTLSASLQQLIIQAPIPADLEAKICHYYSLIRDRAGKDVCMAMRSSATGEDIPGISFAGQYRTQLNVSPENILQAYKEIVASKYSLQAMAYRLNRGIPDENVAMSVICMVMVDAVAGGVMYTKQPGARAKDSLLINSVWGLPKAVVDGSDQTDTFIISRNKPLKILSKKIPLKTQKFVAHPKEGILKMSLEPEVRSKPSLTDKQALELAQIGLKIEKYFGVPQDIEWTIDQRERIVLVQCRPCLQISMEQMKEKEEPYPAPIILKGGITASPGVAVGEVYQVKKSLDLLQFPKGAILVAAQALPMWAPLLSRAAAIVTEQGGITGHLATVAREFGVPALFGLKDAMKLLKNGDIVTVDADRHRIFKGQVKELLKTTQEPLNIMKGTPVYECLKNIVQYIIPLNLFDPNSPTFNPKYCKTFHDITRFCHEKAVVEMFRFGRDHHFPERSAKQLYLDVPMQFWVINLDDGFKEEVENKWIKLENICSVPMLALWEGMTAVPWQGPPPVDSKGFMSVVFEATANPDLDPAKRTSYGIRNYFMISRNFCSLQSRFGFHFSTVEAIVGERASENYISFRFKGGAADLKRRTFRAQFISEILEQYDFRTEVKEDALFARLEGYERPFMELRLRILGYLIIHTRQLDMIMTNRTAINHYREKILKDLSKLIASNNAT